MARIPRVVAENLPHHLIQRGNRNQRVFFQPSDHAEYLRLLTQYSQAHRVRIWAYCLMDTHVHLVVVPEQAASLAKCFAKIHQRYTRMINFRHGWRGYLWQGRFSSYLMDEPHLYAAIRYVERNPVAAGMVGRAEKYPWSSAKAHVFKLHDPLLSPCYLEQEITDWAAFLKGDDPQEAGQVEKHLRTGRPLGSPTFVQQLEERLNRRIGKGKPGPKRASGNIGNGN